MNYDIKIKSKQGEVEQYYYADPDNTQGGETLYKGNIAGRAFWYDDGGGNWWNTLTDDIGYATDGTGKYQSPTLFGTYSDVDLNEIESKQYTLGDAWWRAETTVFESLREYSGCTEEKECFRGYMPELTTQEATHANVWSLNSGNSSEFDIERLTDNNALWCSLRNNVEIESLWTTREAAMRFAGMVECWLKETNNLQGTDSVTWCRLLELPDQPTPENIGNLPGHLFWRLTISLEIIYKTEVVYT